MMTAGKFGWLFPYENLKYISIIIKLCDPIQHYGTFLVAQHASKPAEYKGVD